MGALIRRCPATPCSGGCAPLRVSSSWETSSWSRGRSRSASAVNTRRRVERTKSREPICSSSRLTRFTTTEGATPMTRAAAEKLPERAVARNALISSSIVIRGHYSTPPAPSTTCRDVGLLSSTIGRTPSTPNAARLVEHQPEKGLAVPPAVCRGDFVIHLVRGFRRQVLAAGGAMPSACSRSPRSRRSGGCTTT